MNRLRIILDTIPQHVGHEAGDWAGIFVSRLAAKPLIERDMNGTYRFGLVSKITRQSNFLWLIELCSDSGVTASEVLAEWRIASARGHASSMYFLKSVARFGQNRILLETRFPCGMIEPFLDSPWLWIGMSTLAQELSVTKTDFGAEAKVRLRTGVAVSLDLVLDGRPLPMDGMPSIVAGLPAQRGDAGSVLATDVQFAVVPHANTDRLGPFVSSSMLEAARNDVAERGLLGPLPSLGRAPWPQSNLDSRRIETLVHTEFYPNSSVANCVSDNFQLSTGSDLMVTKAPYVEPYSGYGISPDSGDLLPITPGNSSAAVIARNFLSITKQFMTGAEIEDIEYYLRCSDAATTALRSEALAMNAADRIAEFSGYAVVGKYLGRFCVDGPGKTLISSAGYIDIERMYE